MIVFAQVTKQFGDNPPAVAEVSFNVEDGEFLFLTGHSGSGKTTLLKLLTKEYLLTEGEIEFDGTPLSQIKNSKLHHHRRKIGVIYQDYRLLPELNVWENIALALEIIGKPQHEIEERVTDLLELVQLTDKVYFFPAELSGGESQRVGIARALATAPALILADEPTGNLDQENALLIARLFNKIHELGTTILFATHSPVILETLGHRRLTMEKGRVIADTPATKGKPQKAAPKAAAANQSDKPAKAKTTDKEPPARKMSDPTGRSTQAASSTQPAAETAAPGKVAAPERKRGFRLPAIKLPRFGGRPPAPRDTNAKDDSLPTTTDTKVGVTVEEL